MAGCCWSSEINTLELFVVTGQRWIVIFIIELHHIILIAVKKRWWDQLKAGLLIVFNAGFLNFLCFLSIFWIFIFQDIKLLSKAHLCIWDSCTEELFIDVITTLELLTWLLILCQLKLIEHLTYTAAGTLWGFWLTWDVEAILLLNGSDLALVSNSFGHNIQGLLDDCFMVSLYALSLHIESLLHLRLETVFDIWFFMVNIERKFALLPWLLWSIIICTVFIFWDVRFRIWLWDFWITIVATVTQIQ